jgi:hypothetical protein
MKTKRTYSCVISLPCGLSAKKYTGSGSSKRVAMQRAIAELQQLNSRDGVFQNVTIEVYN